MRVRTKTTNAALRCEQRDHETNLTTVNTELNDGMKNANRCESLLNALLCLYLARDPSHLHLPIFMSFAVVTRKACPRF